MIFQLKFLEKKPILKIFFNFFYVFNFVKKKKLNTCKYLNLKQMLFHLNFLEKKKLLKKYFLTYFMFLIYINHQKNILFLKYLLKILNTWKYLNFNILKFFKKKKIFYIQFLEIRPKKYFEAKKKKTLNI